MDAFSGGLAGGTSGTIAGRTSSATVAAVAAMIIAVASGGTLLFGFFLGFFRGDRLGFGLVFCSFAAPDFGGVLDGFNEGVHDDLDGFHGVIVGGDRIIDVFGIAVGVDDGHNRNSELVGFADGDFVMADVHDNHHIGQFLHIGDSVEILVKFFGLTGEKRDFFFLEGRICFGNDLVDLLHFADGLADRGNVGEGSAHPSFGHIVHAGGVGGFSDDLLRLTLGADEKKLAAGGHGALQEIAGVGDLMNGLGDVDDGDTVFGTINEILHLGVPAFRLMSEMTSRFEKILDCERHSEAAFLFSMLSPGLSMLIVRQDTFAVFV
ncbi:hypothetical protein SDC9_153663 [bioreactor metagenome]|uniref:Uncharacterized protein n=1 Tax=bioreactor metagenome TaxID=1076179 RepID=A0A645EWZ4_9ZZZZ